MTWLLLSEASPEAGTAAATQLPATVDSAALLSCQGPLGECVHEALQAVASGATTLKLKVRLG